jgi:UDP-N-acetyl-D-mannosaminuronic acid dehydrogenase
LPLEEVLARSDILIMCTPHRIYKTLELGGKPILDVWDFVRAQSGL